jgi:hypothetical protein
MENASDEIRAVAVSQGSRFAVGDSRGVWVGSADDAPRRHWLRGAVRRIQFLAGSGAGTRGGTDAADLLVATQSGLYRVGFESAGLPISPAPGASAADVSQIATAGRVTAIATGDGVFVSLDARVWQRLGGPVPSGPASSVALRERIDGIECWAVIRGRLWRVVLLTADPAATRPRTSGQELVQPMGSAQFSFRPMSANPIELPLGPGAGETVDIVLDIDGVESAIVYKDAIVASHTDASQPSGLGWEVLRPGLAPGASIVELAQALGWCWLATDRGLYRSPNLQGPWSPANGPYATRPVGDLATNGRQDVAPRIDPALYVATDRGLMVATADSGVDAPEIPHHDSHDPSIDRVHRAALDYLELGPSRVREFNEGLDLRGWLPAVGFSFSGEKDKSRGTDHDEAFLSGGLRALRDWDRDRSTGFELRLNLSWGLGDIAYHPERLDISREAREIIELRDEVLDELTQLYFERQRVLAELHSNSGDRDELPLKIRADQLAAGIDAWTGGWFSARTRILPHDPKPGSYIQPGPEPHRRTFTSD